MLTLSLQVGDALDPEFDDAPTVAADSMEECDGHIHYTVLPEHGKVPVLHSSKNYRELMQTPLSLPEEMEEWS